MHAYAHCVPLEVELVHEAVAVPVAPFAREMSATMVAMSHVGGGGKQCA